jgi:uncharacterized repeat protein (TIGR01451 family)
MQSGNPIFKLTALAGCVGLGLLGLMQFQRSLAPKSPANTAKSAKLGDFKPLVDLGQPGDLQFENDLPPANSEPRELTSRSNSKATSSSNEKSLDLMLDEFSVERTESNASASSGKRSTASDATASTFDNLEDDLSFGQSEPKSVPLANRAPRAELTLEGFPDDPFGDPPSKTAAKPPVNSEPAELPAFDSEPQPIPVPKADKSKAQQLLRQARKLMADGLLNEARQKATEAAEIPVTYTALEDSPDAVLQDIDQLAPSPPPGNTNRLAAPANESIKLASANKANKSGTGLSLEVNDGPSFDEPPSAPVLNGKSAPKKLSLEDDVDLFADNPPRTINGKARLPDPPVPPAEESERDFPPLPDDADAAPMKSLEPRHRGTDEPAPKRIQTTQALPIELPDPDTPVPGEGTVGQDAPRGPQRPELKIEKIAPPYATLNQPMVYTIVIRNVGDSAANSVVVEDEIPKGTNLTGTIPRAELTGKKLLWKLGTIKPGDQKEIQVKVVPIAEGQVGSIATVSFAAEVASRTTIASPRLSLRLTAAPQVRLGDTITLNFLVSNTGTVDAQRVVLRNIMPENLKLADVSERDLEYEIGTIPAGKSQSVQLPLTAIRAGKATNKALISSGGSVVAEQEIEINVIGQLIGLSRHGASSWYVGRPIEFENRLTNNSLNAVTNTTVVESLPSTVEFISASDGGRFDPRQRTVTWNIAHLDPNQTLVLKLKVLPKTIGNHSGSVQVSENNRKGASVDYQFRAIGTAVLGVEFSDKSEAYSKGEQFTTRMVIRNKGSGVASNVSVRMTIPAELQFVAARGPVSHTVQGRDILFEPIREIGGQGNVQVDLTFKAITAGDSMLRVELQSDQFKKPLAHEEPLIIFGGN